MEVYIVILEHKHGTDITVFDSMEKAEADVFNHVHAYWNDEILEEFGPISNYTQYEARDKWSEFNEDREWISIESHIVN